MVDDNTDDTSLAPDNGSDNQIASNAGVDDQQTDAVNSALKVVNDAMMYGRQKYGLPGATDSSQSDNGGFEGTPADTPIDDEMPGSWQSGGHDYSGMRRSNDIEDRRENDPTPKGGGIVDMITRSAGRIGSNLGDKFRQLTDPEPDPGATPLGRDAGVEDMEKQ